MAHLTDHIDDDPAGARHRRTRIGGSPETPEGPGCAGVCPVITCGVAAAGEADATAVSRIG